MINVLAQGHNAVMPVRLEPAALRSRAKHSTTEPLCSLLLIWRFQNLCSSEFEHEKSSITLGPDVIKTEASYPAVLSSF